MSGWIGVDLDGTLAEYHGWKDDGSVGAPISAMVERVQAWIRERKEVRIVTARVSGRSTAEVLEQTRIIEAWCLEHIGYLLDVTCCKDFSMIELWDDRCVQVETNTGRPIVAESSVEAMERLID